MKSCNFCGLKYSRRHFPVSSRIFENLPSDICRYLSRQGPKGRCLPPLWPKITLTKQKKVGKNRKGERKEGGEVKEKWLHSFLYWLLRFRTRKNCLTEEVYSAVTFAKMLPVIRSTAVTTSVLTEDDNFCHTIYKQAIKQCSKESVVATKRQERQRW